MVHLSTLRLVPVMLLVVALAGCSTIRQQHGYAPSDEEVAGLEPGVSNAQQVINTFGVPTMVEDVFGTTWIYVESSTARRGWNAPETQRRRVVAISFDETGVITNVEVLALEDGQEVARTRRVTESFSDTLSVFEQLFSNFGRIGAADILN